jgi:hypothetical protein
MIRDRLTAPIGIAIALLTTVVLAVALQNIAGTVTDWVTGEPLSGIEVSFLDATNAERLASATADDFGRYDSGTLPIGSYRVRFPGQRSQYFGAGGVDDFCAGTIVPVDASMTTALDTPLIACPKEDECGPRKAVTGEVSLSGTVVDAATGAPLQGIRVSVLEAFSAEPFLTLTTDAAGSYAYTAEPAYLPAVRIRFTDPGGVYAPQFYGAGADAFCSAATVDAMNTKARADGFLERVPPDQLTRQLADTVQSYALPPDVSTMLGTPLTQVRKLLADDRDGNNAAACGQLSSFGTRVDVQERRGELSATEASELRRLTATLRTELGCR